MQIARRALMAIAVLSLGLSAWGGFAAAQDEWQKTVAAAKTEGKLVVYSVYVGAPSSRAIAKAFEAKYGVAVELLEGRGSEIRERIRTEQSAGRFAADLLFTTLPQAVLQDTEDKAFEPLPQVPNLDRLTGAHKASGVFMPAMTTHYGILINTGLVKPEDEPKSWKDLADPKWKGKILADDPRSAGGGYMSFFVHHEAPGLGLAFLEAYAAQAPVLTRDQGQSAQRVARGEFALYTPFVLSDYDKLKGLPVKYIIPSEGVTYVLFGHALMKNAPRPNAAKLYLDFVLSDEAQLIWARDGNGSMVSDIAAKTPEAVRPIASAKLLGAADPLRQNEMMAIAKRLFK